MATVEFVVRGTPVSHQAHDRRVLRAWQNRVTRTVLDQLPARHVPASRRVHLRVTYIQDYPVVRIDVDNLVKPIQDALQDVLYVDDVWIAFLTVKKNLPEALCVATNPSGLLLRHLSQPGDFVYIQLDDDPGYEVLP